MPYGDKVGDVARRFGINPQTVRQWADEFAGYLSPDANPAKGETRVFDNDDLQVLALVAYMRNQGAGFDEIKAALDSGQRGLMMDVSASQGATGDGINAGAYLARVEDLARDLGFTKGELSRVERELIGEKQSHDLTRQRETEARERAAAAQARLSERQGTAGRVQWASVALLAVIAIESYQETRITR